MTKRSFSTSAFNVTAILSFCQVANLIALMTFPSVLPAVTAEWHLSSSEAGWIGGIYFAGYAAAVPFLSRSTDRIDGRWIVGGSSLLGAAVSFAFSAIADGFWAALVFRFLGGAALAGVAMPGLVLLAQHVEGPRQQRCVSVYSSSYALGSAASFLVAGVVDAMFGWRAVFVAGGLGPLLAVVAVACLPRSSSHPSSVAEQGVVVPAIRNRAFMAYVVAFAGNTWEVFGIRVWFVACLAWTLRVPGNKLDLPNLALISGLAALMGVPASILVAELATRWQRPHVIAATCLASGVVCLALAATAGGPIILVLVLLILLQISSFADVGALGVGAVSSVDPRRRGAALAIYSLAGYTTGLAGSVMFGFCLDWFGGADSRSGWAAAFTVLALGPVVTGTVLWRVRKKDDAALRDAA
ncbi:MFS transporter [Vineibacter terrae]|uniref:MFS transporter n=1 Tax=Vineibacter terrae TaxID=2586908 RepID=UPI0015B5AA2F|nr:MFS transporter [Vineibacter terrae]